jgi:hypothetical protein
MQENLLQELYFYHADKVFEGPIFYLNFKFTGWLPIYCPTVNAASGFQSKSGCQCKLCKSPGFDPNVPLYFVLTVGDRCNRFEKYRCLTLFYTRGLGIVV